MARVDRYWRLHGAPRRGDNRDVNLEVAIVVERARAVVAESRTLVQKCRREVERSERLVSSAKTRFKNSEPKTPRKPR